MKKQENISITVPISLERDHKDAREAADSILFQYKTFGFKRFALVMPEKGWRSVSYPPREYFAEKAELFLQVKSLLPSDISCGWWDMLILKSGPTPGYTRIVRLNGTEAPFSTCPLDENYRKRFAEDVAFVLHKAHPDFYITEDDFGINCHGGPGCFCKHHLEEFARREQRYYSREELEQLFTNQPTAESRELLRRWQALAKDSLVLFASAIRKEADKLTPEIPMGIMQPGSNDRDGNSIESVARAIAGANHTPFARFHGTFYCGEQISSIPQVLFSPIYAKEHIKGEFRFWHESDTFPHTRFYTSGSCMRSLMGAIYSCGYEGSIFQTQQMLDHPDEEQAYGKMFLKERSRFNALRKSVEGCVLRGVQLYYDPFEGANFPGNKPYWGKAVSAFGIPYTTSDDAEITFISGEQMRFMPEEKIRLLLSKSLVIDGAAARVLTERNFSEFTGVRTEGAVLQGNDRFDLGAREIIDDRFCVELKGRQMARADMYCPKGNGFLHKLVITDPACQEVTRIVNFRHEYMAPGMTFFKNALGGNVITYATAVENHLGSSLFNYRRQALLQDLLIRCGAAFPMAKNVPQLFLIANEPKVEKDFAAFLTCINLAVDPLDELHLYLPEHLRQFRKFSSLDRNGNWQEIPYEKNADGVCLQIPFNYAEPVYIRIS